ncbi:unnamed protein product [Meloidogyne enterolobii]|uniref:Uncharacterized protein n=1 Tax=Meloidogyne enterolobii TaxID=390850 RepID=A0ACB1AHW1_MELEN
MIGHISLSIRRLLISQQRRCLMLYKRKINRTTSFRQNSAYFEQSSTNTNSSLKLDNQDEDQILEYYEVEEEGVDVPMVAETEPYLRRDLQLRDFSTLSPNEIVEVLEDQRAKDIVCFQASEENDNVDENNNASEQQQEQLRPYSPFTIICSPYNKRHGKALMTIVRAFVKRNFLFEGPKDIPHRFDKDPSGWYMLDLKNVTVHIIEEDLRKRYDLESLILGKDEEETSNWWETNEYAVSELIANIEEEGEQKKPKKIRGIATDPFIRPLR